MRCCLTPKSHADWIGFEPERASKCLVDDRYPWRRRGISVSEIAAGQHRSPQGLEISRTNRTEIGTDVWPRVSRVRPHLVSPTSATERDQVSLGGGLNP